MHGRAARGPRRQGCNRGAVRGLRAVRRHMASTAGAVPGAILDVVTRGSHRGAAAVAVNRTGSRRPQGVGHVRLGESTPVHRTRLQLRVPQCPTSRPCARDVFTSSPHRGPDRSPVGGCGPVW